MLNIATFSPIYHAESLVQSWEEIPIRVVRGREKLLVRVIPVPKSRREVDGVAPM